MSQQKKGLPAAWGVLALSLVLALVSFLPSSAYAQVLYGSITGNVTDASAAAIPGAEVVIVNNATNYTQSAVTNETGTYSLQNVPQGSYRLTVTLPGFKEYRADNVAVTVGNVTRQNVTLQVGEITDQVTVSAAATALQTDTTDVRVALESEEITNLPLPAYRNYQSLINLVPGSTPAAFQNAITDTPGRALTTNINGTARNNNNTRIDGAMSVNIWLPHHTAYVPPAETIEVANITTNNFDAETGFAGGAAITVVTKSGTNEIHGSLFGLHENSAVGARNFFVVGENPNSIRNIDGFTIGGPVIKDKLFYFGGWEGSFERLAATRTETVATAAQRAGDFSGFNTVIYDPLTGNPDGTGRTPFANNMIPADRIHPASKLMQDLIPLPNLGGTRSNFQRSGVQKMNRNNYDAKMDWYRSDDHRIWGKFSWMDALVVQDAVFGQGGGPAIGAGGAGEGNTDVKVYGIGHNWTLSPTFLVDGNFGFTDMDQVVEPFDSGLGNFGSEVLGLPGTNATDPQSCPENRCAGIPRFSITGFTALGNTEGWNPIFRDEDSYTFTQNFSLSRGDHEVRFGYDMVRHMLDHWQPEIGDGPRGGFNFNREMTSIPGATPIDQNAYAGYLLGLPNSMGKSLQWELMTAREWQHAWYVRDRWQATSNLTFTLGLRYEYFPLVSRQDRPMEFLDLNTFDVVLSNNIDVSKTLFAPRLGLAYRLSENDVVRAGYGITNDPLPFARPLRGFFPLTVAASFSQNNVFDPFRNLSQGIPLFLGPDLTAGSVPLPSFVTQRTMPPDRINRGYIQSWNMVYERKLPSEFVVSLGYVGTQTTNQLADFQMNWAPPGGGVTGRQLFPQSTVDIMFWDGWLSSNYHSLQFMVNRRFVNGLFVKGAYTYGRAINMTDDDGWAGVNWNDPALIDRNRAQAGYNRPHILQLATIYELPFGRGGDSFANQLVQGWQINGIFSVNENSPFTVGSGGPINTRNNLQTADQVKADVQNLGGIGRGNPYYDKTAFAPVSRVPGSTCIAFECYGNSGRNILRGPTWVNLDLSLFRNFRITEAMGLEFRAEAFNFANNPKFNNPDTANQSASSAGFMEITSTNINAPARVIRFGLKLMF